MLIRVHFFINNNSHNLLKQKEVDANTRRSFKSNSIIESLIALKDDLVVIHNTCSEKEESKSETASSKSVKECSLDSETNMSGNDTDVDDADIRPIYDEEANG
ncbi:hypothetical protein Tco_0349231 [Tanacetum coccineum]